MSDHQSTADHLVNTGKILAGGAGVGGGTYATILSMDIANATAIATLLAAVATTIYFLVAAGYAAWKWYHEVYAGK